MSISDEDAYTVFVVTSRSPPISGRESQVRRWAVLTANIEAAVAMVGERLAPDCIVEASDEVLPAEAVTDFLLMPHEPRRL